MAHLFFAQLKSGRARGRPLFRLTGIYSSSSLRRAAHPELCGQPALRGRDLCRFHLSVAPVRREFILPIVEDAASLQLALNRVMRALADDLLTYKKASLLLYALQISASNFKRLRDERQDSKNRATAGEEESLVKLLCQQLSIPETPEELAAEFGNEPPNRAPWPGLNFNPPIANATDRPITGSPDHPMPSDHPITGSPDKGRYSGLRRRRFSNPKFVFR